MIGPLVEVPVLIGLVSGKCGILVPTKILYTKKRIKKESGKSHGQKNIDISKQTSDIINPQLLNKIMLLPSVAMPTTNAPLSLHSAVTIGD